MTKKTEVKAHFEIVEESPERSEIEISSKSENEGGNVGEIEGKTHPGGNSKTSKGFGNKKKKWIPNIAPLPDHLKPGGRKVSRAKEKEVIPETVWAEDEEELKEMALMAGYQPGNPYSSIFGMSKFPTIGHQRHKFTPKDILKAMYLYGTGTEQLEECLQQCGISKWKFHGWVLKSHPIVGSILQIARAMRANTFAQSAIQPYLEQFPEEFMEETKFGSRPSPGGVQHIRNAADKFFNLAQMNERGAYNVDKEKVGNIHIEAETVNINLGDIMRKPLSELGDVL